MNGPSWHEAPPDSKAVPSLPPTAEELPEPSADGIRTVPDRPAPLHAAMYSRPA
jgi:hypothetical protein